ncbi:uncharacterized protein STAUR_1761 [Stigmatella aurantiaca DW4/3-1]|uniref:JAB domain-containing protein n=1 Tax=Stigmatella aurantiaca (strain DW4/3-1) TaxID=378806 RepID=E3FS30_STIAD|nr:uncharacterized protein STAUR_1761 [Stigmatella aurantiaca DW4/3-1]
MKGTHKSCEASFAVKDDDYPASQVWVVGYVHNHPCGAPPSPLDLSVWPTDSCKRKSDWVTLDFCSPPEVSRFARTPQCRRGELRLLHESALSMWIQERQVSKGCVLAVLATVVLGCVKPASVWKGQLDWPDGRSATNVIPAVAAGATLAAAAAVREMVRTNPYPSLFRGCDSPEQGLDVAVFTGPTPGLYYVVLHQRFDRCGGPSGRVLDGQYIYAVTPQGEVVGEAPPPAGEAIEPFSAPPPTPPPSTPLEPSAVPERPVTEGVPQVPELELLSH